MTAQEIVTKVKSLPPVSHAALKLVGLLDQAESGNEEIVEVLKHDSVLTAKLLKACNSPAVGLAEPVTSVDQAVLILGHKQILQMVTAIAFGGAMAVRLPGYSIEADELWRHSLITASAAQILTDGNPDLADASVAFTVGLLHDIGKLVLGQLLTDDTRAAVRHQIAEGIAAADAERSVFGADHAEVGGCLLASWRLPEEIVEAVANHHHPVVEPRLRLSALTHVANCLAHLVGAAPGWEAYAIRGDERVIKLMKIDQATLERLIISVRDSFERADQLMALA
jgi:putative nucleotidyltransferase with HDIG domain